MAVKELESLQAENRSGADHVFVIINITKICPGTGREPQHAVMRIHLEGDWVEKVSVFRVPSWGHVFIG